MNIDNQDLKAALDCLRKGGVILYPTDTVWGIGCDATNQEAVERVFKIKNRADSKALIALVGSEGQLERAVEEVPEVAWQLIQVSDRPVTVVYDNGLGVAPQLLAADGSLAIRLTREEFSRQLCLSLGRPIVSTSANVSGAPAPATFQEIPEEILSQVDYVCTSGRDSKTKSKPSMVIKISSGGLFRILRD
ncbi:MAG: threonylcarbamoyl-AMP synthase [Bacteroidales bacterium]|nr:threonylcarbamoyl-AMP synthase [Bacteroidales bacterium]